MSLAAAVSPADELRFVEFSDISLIEGSLGDFYLIEGPDYVAKQKVYLRVDARFKDLIEPELAALNAEQPATFCVVVDPRRKQSNHFRVHLDYYRARAEEEVQVEAVWADECLPVGAREPASLQSITGQLKSITATVPLEVHATLRDLHKRQTRYMRFTDFVSVLLCKSTELITLG